MKLNIVLIGLVIIMLFLFKITDATTWYSHPDSVVKLDLELRLTENNYNDYLDGGWDSNTPNCIAATPDGRVHVVWWTDTGGPSGEQVHYRRYNPGSGWSSDTSISMDLGSHYQSHTPALAVDSSGRLHVVWHSSSSSGDDHIYYKSCLPIGNGNGGWDSASKCISVDGRPYQHFQPDIACSPDGHVHVVWRKFLDGAGIAYTQYRERIDTVWQNVLTLHSQTYMGGPGIAAGHDNNVHVTWQAFQSGSYHDIVYKGRYDGTWTSNENVSSTTPGRECFQPSIACNPTNNSPHIIWWVNEPDRMRIVHSYRTTYWQLRDTLSESILTTSQTDPHICFFSNGVAYAVWCGRNLVSPLYNQVRGRIRSVGGNWGDIFEITTGAFNHAKVKAYASCSTDVHIIWEDFRFQHREIYYQHNLHTNIDEMVIQLVSNEIKLSITPNPAFQATTIKYLLPKDGKLSLKIYNPAGILIKSYNNFVSNLEGNFILDTKELPSGIYILQFNFSGLSVNRKFVIEK